MTFRKLINFLQIEMEQEKIPDEMPLDRSNIETESEDEVSA
jgi:hypothetical protein